MNKKLRANLLLLLVTVIWGGTFPFIKKAMQYIDPSVFVSARFVLAAICLLPFVMHKLVRTNKKMLKAGLILGFLNMLAYSLQTIGLRETEVGVGAFIATSGVVFVPFLAPLLNLGKIKVSEVWASLLCLFGLYVLIGGHFKYFTSGESLPLLSSLSWALSVCYLQKVTLEIRDSTLLAFYQIVFILPFSFGLTAITGAKLIDFNLWIVLILLYMGILATSLIFLIQTHYQRDTSATQAAIIYSLEPVFASVLAIFINDEPLSFKAITGGTLILLSILLLESAPYFSLKWQKYRSVIK